MRAISFGGFLTVLLAAAVAMPQNSQRIDFGSVTPITYWSYTAALLYGYNLQTYIQDCGGTIITRSAILTAASCVSDPNPARRRVRVGSGYANSGGVVHIIRLITRHHRYHPTTYDNNLAVLRTSINIAYNANVRPARIAGPDYSVPVNKLVWAVGWGRTQTGLPSEQLRQAHSWIVNQDTCRDEFADAVHKVTENMLCAGWPAGVSGRGMCRGDEGGPLSDGVLVVGISSWSQLCQYPRQSELTVSVRVSRYIDWIQAAAA